MEHRDAAHRFVGTGRRLGVDIYPSRAAFLAAVEAWRHDPRVLMLEGLVLWVADIADEWV
jgi:hypothetical protein